MTSRLRRGLLAALGAAAIIAAPLIVASPAAAADLTGSTPLFFSNPAFTDADEEDVQMAAALTDAGAVVTLFDGGDGSDVAWNTALAGRTVLVLPEMENAQFYTVGGTSAVSDAAALAISAWVHAGGRIVSADPYWTLEFFDVLAGAAVFTVPNIFAYDGSPWPLLVPTDGLPATVSNSDATDPFNTLVLGTEFLSIYGTPAVSPVTQFPFGSGYLTVLGYDWYPNPDDIANGFVAEWNLVLQQSVLSPFGVVPPPAPSPALVATGGPSFDGLLVGAFAIVLIGSGVLAFRTRANSAAR